MHIGIRIIMIIITIQINNEATEVDIIDHEEEAVADIKSSEATKSTPPATKRTTNTNTAIKTTPPEPTHPGSMTTTLTTITTDRRTEGGELNPKCITTTDTQTKSRPCRSQTKKSTPSAR